MLSRGSDSQHHIPLVMSFQLRHCDGMWRSTGHLADAYLSLPDKSGWRGREVGREIKKSPLLSLLFGY